ncbi:MAG: hypothetical protein R3B70_29380 [Polyangiaceae bacterium]
MRERVDDVGPSLAVLTRHLGNRLLLVDDIDLLLPSASHADLRDVVGDRKAALDDWLHRHAVLCTRAGSAARAPWQPREVALLQDPPLRLLNSGVHDVGPTWRLVGRNPEHFRLALTLAMLEERVPDEIPGREETLLEEVWFRLPGAS